MTDGTLIRHGKRAYTGIDLDDLGDNLVGLDDADLCTRAADAQTLALADIAERSTFDGGAFQFDRLEDGDG